MRRTTAAQVHAMEKDTRYPKRSLWTVHYERPGPGVRAGGEARRLCGAASEAEEHAAGGGGVQLIEYHHNVRVMDLREGATPGW